MVNPEQVHAMEMRWLGLQAHITENFDVAQMFLLRFGGL